MKCVAYIAAGICMLGLFGSEAQARMLKTSYYNSVSADVAASLEYPFGTILRLTNPRNGRSTTVRIHDTGPFRRGRQLDISRTKAKELGFLVAGVIDLESEVVHLGTGRKYRSRN